MKIPLGRNAAILLLIAAGSACAQTDRAVLVREANVYLAASTGSSKLGTALRGRELAVLEKGSGWARVLVTVEPPHQVTGWILDKGLVRASTPNGDRILYGEAVNSEDEASRRLGRKGAAQEAMRLYARTAEYFPNSPFAAEALYRAADDRWQLDRADLMTRPSSKEIDLDLRVPIETEYMQQVIKKYPHTKWADLAAYAMLDNKICFEWQGVSKCPERETDLYEKYANEHPQSPKAAEALYNAAYRQSALVEIYKTEENPGKSSQARDRALRLAQRIVSQFPDTDYANRAIRLIYLVEQNIPTYGNAVE